MLDKAFAERIIHDYKVPGAGAGRGGSCVSELDSPMRSRRA